MSITLTDIPDAVDEYLETQVITTVSPVTPKDEKQDVLTPGQDGRVTVTATNGDATKGVRLRNLVYQVTVKDGAVLKLIPPAVNSVSLQAFEDKEATKPINDTKARKEFFVVPLINNVLDAGEAGTISLDVHCLDQGQTSITARLHADVDQDELFPTSKTKNGEQTVDVV